MIWSITFSRNGLKSFDKVDKGAQKRIRHYLELKVAPDPTALGEAMVGDKKGYWRYRVGDYRVIVKIFHGELMVLVVQVGKRGDVYRAKL